MLASAVRTRVTGRILPEVADPLDAVLVIASVGLLVFFFLWLPWLALRLWQGSPPGDAGTLAVVDGLR